MSKVIIDEQPLNDLADLLRAKSAVVGRVKLTEMVEAVSAMHGYQSKARGLPSDPVSTGVSAFDISELQHVSVAALSE